MDQFICFSYQLCKKYYYKQQHNCLQLSFGTRSLFLIRLFETVCSSLDMFLPRLLPAMHNLLTYSLSYSILFYSVYHILLDLSNISISLNNSWKPNKQIMYIIQISGWRGEGGGGGGEWQRGGGGVNFYSLLNKYLLCSIKF